MFNFFKKITEDDLWKEKAKKRAKKNKDLKKENERLKKSRNKWRNEADKYKELNIKLDYELKKN